MWRRLESIENNPLRKRSGDFLNPGLSWTSFKQPTLKISTTLLEQNKQYHFKVLLCSFHLNSHNLGSHPRTQMFLSPREWRPPPKLMFSQKPLDTATSSWVPTLWNQNMTLDVRKCIEENSELTCTCRLDFALLLFDSSSWSTNVDLFPKCERLN